MSAIEERSQDSVLIANGRPQAVFIPSAPLEDEQRSAHRMKQLVKKLSPATVQKIKSSLRMISGDERVAAGVQSKVYQEDSIEEMVDLNWLFPSISPHKYGVKRKQNVSLEYRTILSELRRIRMGLEKLPVLEIATGNTSLSKKGVLSGFVPLFTGQNSVVETLLKEINSTNPLVQILGSTSANQSAIASTSQSSTSANQISFAGQRSGSLLAKESSVPILGSYRDLNSSLSTYGATISSFSASHGGRVKSQSSEQGFVRIGGKHSFQTLEGAYRASLASKRSTDGFSFSHIGSNQAAGLHDGFLISVDSQQVSYKSGQTSGNSSTSAAFMKQPCVWLFKAVDPPPMKDLLAQQVPE